MKKVSFSLLCLLVFNRPSPANDSFAAIGAGGITLEKTDGVVMESEDLYLSLRQVKVRYQFFNSSDKDITTLIAFPVPEIPVYEYDEGNKHFLTDANPMKFQVTVNGKPVETKLERKQIKPDLHKLTYYWEQTFPKNQRMTVEHTYVPAVGGFLYDPKHPGSAVATYCIEPGLQATLKKAVLGSESGIIPAQQLVYILSTGSHWKGPIKDFRLVIDKEKPQTLISLCADEIRGIQKISPTRFEVRKKDFLPTQDVKISFFPF